MLSNHKQWVSEVFDRAASHYGEKSASFFSYFGKRLVEQVSVIPNQHVLDVATGRGAVLFPLANSVGPLGKVVGIDISQQMLKETTQEALNKNFHWVDFQCMDAEQLNFLDNSFDFVFCGFALFFLPSISKALSEFKRVLKPGGMLAISTWGEDSKLDIWVNEEIKKLGTTLSHLAITPFWNEKEIWARLEQANFKDIQIMEETKTFAHSTLKNGGIVYGAMEREPNLNNLQQIKLQIFEKKCLKKSVNRMKVRK